MPFLNAADSLTIIGQPGDLEECRKAVELLRPLGGVTERIRYVAGGASRQDSVRCGLQSLADAPGDAVVLVHDAARPFVSVDLIERCIASAVEYGSGVAAVPVHDTIRRADENDVPVQTVDRTGLWAMQTPQAFRLDLLRRASDRAEQTGFQGTDEASLVEQLQGVRLVKGDRENIKITTSDDLRFAEQWLGGRMPEMRVGCGYDIHRLVEGRDLWLGGVKIPYDRGLDGHSDADVALHAICDALLGAAGMPDIGQLYPNTDESITGASSIGFLMDVADRLASAGWTVMNVDCTLIAERPKIGPYVSRMREKISYALKIEPARVGIKATTNEGLDDTGAGAGIACHAAACLIGCRR